MTMAQRAKTIIDNAISKNKWPVNGVYCYNIPSNVQDDTTTTVICITEVNDMPTTYGSDCSTEMQETVAVNIYYANDSTVNMDDLEQNIITAFESEQWYCVYSPGHSLDPDTEQVTKVLQFQKLMKRKEI